MKHSNRAHIQGQWDTWGTEESENVGGSAEQKQLSYFSREAFMVYKNYKKFLPLKIWLMIILLHTHTYM